MTRLVWSLVLALALALLLAPRFAPPATVPRGEPMALPGEIEPVYAAPDHGPSCKFCRAIHPEWIREQGAVVTATADRL